MDKETKVAVEFIESFKGVLYSYYEDTYNYVINGGWEKDYFADWLVSCSDYPNLDEIEYFCKQVEKQIAIYIDYVEEVKHKQRS